MARRILNRKDLRADFDAAERRKDETEEQDEDEEENEDEEDGEEDEESSDEEEEPSDEDEERDEEAPPPKKKKVKPKAPPKKSRARTPKIVRMRVVWGVFDNSNRCVASYEYPRKPEAEAHAARLTSDKRSTHFIQPVKEPIEEKKDEPEKEKKEKK